MSLKFKAKALPDSDEESIGLEDESVQDRVKLMRELASRERLDLNFVGGIVISSESESNALSSNASLSAAEKKGLKEVAELERELDLKNTFSKETNRRDEDAEMNKYIDEQIRQRREAAEVERRKKFKHDTSSRSSQQDKTSLHEIFNLPTAAVVADAATEKVDDILLHTLAKNYSTITDEKSEAMLSNQMLNGIPEVDLGMGERIRTIEATEEARLSMASSSSRAHRPQSSRRPDSIAPINFSSNFQQHRSSRGKNDGELRSIDSSRDSRSLKADSARSTNDVKTISEPVVLVGEEPKEIEIRAPTKSNEHRPPMRGRASDDYYLQKFKKNSRR